MIFGWFFGQPVAKAVAKSADADRLVMGSPHDFEQIVWRPELETRSNSPASPQGASVHDRSTLVAYRH
jgi:hypothetical protein